MGLVKTADTGQINFDLAEARALTTNPSFPVTNAFDTNTAAVYQSTAAPSVDSPQWVLFDAGLGNTFTPASWAIYTSNLAADPKDTILQHSADGAAWTDFDTRALLASTGYQSFNVVGAPARRYWRALVTTTQNTTTFLQISEFQLWTGVGLSGLRATPVAIRPTSANQSAGFQMFRLDDALQATAPCFVKVEYGTGGQATWPGLFLTVGTSVDGAGNLTGVSLSERRQLSCNGNVTTAQKCAVSGANNRFAAALFYNSTTFLWFALERSKNAAGADTGEALVLAGQSGGQKFALYVTASGAPPASESDFGCVAPTVGTGARGNAIALYGISPFAPDEKPQMLSAMAYFNTDLSAEVPITGVKLYGQVTDRTVMPLGNSITTVARANANTRLALIWE
jgi:hypothetical protein